jgi:hypothetical protein
LIWEPVQDGVPAAAWAFEPAEFVPAVEDGAPAVPGVPLPADSADSADSADPVAGDDAVVAV